MISVCILCGAVMDEKEPLEDKSRMRGLCFYCLPQWLVDIGGFTEAEAMIEALKIKEKYLKQ